MSPKIPPKAPQEGHDMGKNRAVTLKETPRMSTKFLENILNVSQKVDVICPRIL